MPISNARITTTALTTVYTSVGNNAVTTLIVCNTATPNLTDETENACNLTLYMIPKLTPPQNAGDINAVVKNLTIPAGETVFFSDEKVILGNEDVIAAEAQLNGVGALTITVSTLPV
jgi:hypothetical protein